MLRWFHRRLKPFAGAVLAAMLSLWLAAATPCGMAQTPPPDQAVSVPSPLGMDMAPAGVKDCGPAAVLNCQWPDVNPPLAATRGDHVATPALLTTWPVPIILPPTRQSLPRDFLTPDIPAPPLHIRHLTLLL